MSETTSSQDLKFLTLLAEKFPNQQAVYTEIINLQAILDLPRATEHFMSDVHGEYEAFVHILNNCSGVIRERVSKMFDGELSQEQKDELCTLIYYPRERLTQLHEAHALSDQYYYDTLMLLVRLARYLSSFYTRSKVRKAMPEEYAYIIDELLRASAVGETNRHEYHVRIIESIVEVGSADDFIQSLAALIKRLAVDHMHIVGDLFDRGMQADRIIDRLMDYHSLDIQWGNHDICWMGAAAGSEACIASVLRSNIRYNSLDILESAYGISLRELALFAEHTYSAHDVISPLEKAISVILFKVEGQLIMRNPDFCMQDRLLLDKIDLEKGVCEIEGTIVGLRTCDFPTLDPTNPYELSRDERRIMDGLVEAFTKSERLRTHVDFLYRKGSMYLVQNGNLLFHGCIPMTPQCDFATINSQGKSYAGRAYLDYCDKLARRAWNRGDQLALDWMWYLWCGKLSPASGRVVKTFERSYIDDKSTWFEQQDVYYDLTLDPSICVKILNEFGLDETGHIINGHTPVKAAKGESPIKAGGKLLVIDGGFCEAYHSTTGIAGYTLIASAHGMRIKAHRPWQGIEASLDLNADIMSETDTFERYERDLKVADTDTGVKIKHQLEDLQALLEAYRAGDLKEVKQGKQRA